MATSKMFVHYSGTKAAFIAAGLPSQYTNKIVFIKGGENGTGACVYTHGAYYANVEEALAALKYFSSISANGTTATAAGPNGTINFTADDPASVAVKVDSNGVHIALTDEFKTAVNTTLPGRLDAIEGDYLKSADKTELEGKVNTALADAKKYTDEEVSRIVADSGSGLIGTEGDASTANTIYGAKKYADEKAAAAQSAAEATAAGDATSKVNAAKEEIKGTTDALAGRIKAVEDDYLTSADKTEITDAASELSGRVKAIEDDYLTSSDLQEINNAATELEGRVKANEDAIAVLNGEGEGSVKRQVADAVAGVVASAPEDFDTLKEVADWIASDTTGAAKMQADIAKLQGDDTVEGSVAKTVKDAVAVESERALAAEGKLAEDLTAETEERLLAETDLDRDIKAEALRASAAEENLQEAINTISGDYLKAADKTELQGNIDTVSAVANAAAPQATTYTKTEVDGLISGAEGKLADYYKKSETYSQAEVDAMFAWEEL